MANKNQSLKGLRGQTAVVLIIAKSPKLKEFKNQVKALKEIYQQFANESGCGLCCGLLRDEVGPVVSDIPFVVKNNGGAVASAYGVQDKFNIAIIGKDGNLDYQTCPRCSGRRGCTM